MNKQILYQLELLLQLKKQEKDTFRIKAISNGITAIKSLNFEITKKNIDKLNDISGIGKGILSRITEILETNTLKELESVQKLEKMNELETITGIGSVKANELYKQGITTIKELEIGYKEGKIKLTKHQAIGLKYYKDFNERIPRKEIDEFNIILKKIVNSVSKKLNINIYYEIVGSYRRMAENSGDIDVLFTYPNYNKDTEQNILKEIVEKNKDILIDTISLGKTKYMGVGKINNIARRIDFLLVPEDEYPYSILYFTGSGEFNVNMRSKAKELGYKLNEHGLFKNNENIKVKTEKEIFDILGMKYIEPKNRIN